MPITKTVLDIPISTGLSQKFQAELAPSGVSLTATNLVKNKRDSIGMRIGFTPLRRSNLAGTFQHSLGLGLGSHLDKLCVFGQGTYNATLGQKINTISTYSNNTTTTEPQHIVPEVLVSPRQYSVALDNTAYEVDTCAYGDYIFKVWTAKVGTGTNRVLSYMMLEASTKNVIIPATQIDQNDIIAPRVFVVGTSVILTYLNASSFNITGLTWSSAAPLAGFSGSNVIATTVSGASYDADAVAGDAAFFALAYDAGGNSFHISAVAASSLTISATTTVTDANFISPAIGVGVCGDTINGAAASYSYINTYPMISVAVATGWPAIPASCTATRVFNTATTGLPFPPTCIAICSLGTIKQGAGSPVAQSWAIWWGTPGTNLSGTGFNNGKNVGALTHYKNDALPFTYYLSFYLNAGTPTITGGGNMPRKTFGCLPVSRPVFVNGMPYILVYIPSQTQGGYYLCAADYFGYPSDANYYPLRPVATVAPRQCLSDSAAYLPSTVLDGVTVGTYNFNPFISVTPTASVVGSTFTMCHMPSVTTLPYDSRAIVVMTTSIGEKQQPTLYWAEFNSRHTYEGSSHGRSMTYAGGMPGLYDGVQAVETAFPYYPEISPLNAGNGSANFISSGTALTFNNAKDQYNYIATYEWVDAQSQKHISARSPVVPVTGLVANIAIGSPGFGSPFTVNLMLNISSSGLGHRVMPVNALGATLGGPQSIDGAGEKLTIGLYRTALNGTVYYKITDPYNIGDSSALAAGNIYNNLTGTYQVSMTDQLADNGQFGGGGYTIQPLTARPPLYGDGTDGTSGNLDNFNPPSSSILCEHKNRIFLADGNLVWYTKVLTPGEAPGFNETSMIFSVGDQTPITGLASLDDKLVVFKHKNIYFVSGDGPADNGSQNNFTDPQPIPTEIGCNDPRGIAVTPDGVYFMSDAGYRMLDRSMTVQYTGTAVENELQTNTYVTSAVLHPSTNRLILCANPADTSTPLAGEFLYYDYVLDAWTNGFITSGEFVQGPFAAGVGLAPRVSSVLAYEPVLHFIMADGTVWRENDPGAANPYLDNGATFTGTLSTAWIKPANSFDGFNRIWSVNPMIVFFDPCNFTTTVNTDYGAFTQTNTVTLSSANPPASGVAFPMQTYLQNQRLRSMQVVIGMTGAPGRLSVTGQMCAILGITCDVGTYPAAGRMNPGNRN